jgi:hypothetical protein
MAGRTAVSSPRKYLEFWWASEYLDPPYSPSGARITPRKSSRRAVDWVNSRRENSRLADNYSRFPVFARTNLSIDCLRPTCGERCRQRTLSACLFCDFWLNSLESLERRHYYCSLPDRFRWKTPGTLASQPVCVTLFLVHVLSNCVGIAGEEAVRTNINATIATVFAVRMDQANVAVVDGRRVSSRFTLRLSGCYRPSARSVGSCRPGRPVACRAQALADNMPATRALSAHAWHLPGGHVMRESKPLAVAA